MTGYQLKNGMVVTFDDDIDDLAPYVAASVTEWFGRIESLIAAHGDPDQRKIHARVVPSPELREYLASGRGFVVHATALTWAKGGAKDFAPRPAPGDLPLTIVTDPPEDAPGADVTGVPV